MIYDVAIIGAGVVGALTARELCSFGLRVALLEAQHDVAMGTSKGNSAIVHAGFDAAEGSLKAKLNVAGCAMMEKTAKELGVHFKKNGSLVCAFGAAEEEHLNALLLRGRANGVENLSILRSGALRDLEPGLSREVTAALLAPGAGIVCPYHLTIAAAVNAAENGCDVITSFKVDKIEESDGNIAVHSGLRRICAHFAINSAGLYADEIAMLCGDSPRCAILPRRGEYMLLDKTAGNTVSATLFSVPSDQGKGILVSPTVDGNLILGPNANLVGKEDTATTREGLGEIERGAKRLVPGVNMRQVITSFAGVRATPSNHDFNIYFSDNIKNMLHLVGIESPGLASSPAIAVYAAGLLGGRGLDLKKSPDFCPAPRTAPLFRDMDDAARAAAVAADPRYGKIICRCETVTEADIAACIDSPVPAVTLDAVKRRTRAGMGRCQGGFCSPRVVEILARELGIDMLEVTKKGGGSYILTGRTK